MAIGEVPEFAVELVDRLHESGWVTEAKGPERDWPHARVTATHECGASLHVLADRDYNKKGRSKYVRRRYSIGLPWGPKRSRWYEVSLETLLAFAADPGVTAPEGALPTAAPDGEGCQCGKIKMTESEADARLLGAKMRYARGNERRREERKYPCDDDPRVFHLTSKKYLAPSAPRTRENQQESRRT